MGAGTPNPPNPVTMRDKRSGIILNRVLFFALLFFSLALKCTPLLAVDASPRDRLIGRGHEPWTITANTMSYDETKGLYVAEGDVVIKRQGQVISAQKAKYNEKTGVVELSGSVIVKANGDELSGQSALLNLITRRGRISKGHLFIQKNHYYISGDLIQKTGPSTYRVKNCRLTTCDGEKPDWSITGSDVKVTIEGYGSVKNAVFRIRNFPVMYFPYAIFPVKTKRQTGCLPPSIGYSGRNGLEGEVPFFWAFADQMDATFYERLMSKRGLMQGLEARYVAEAGSKGAALFDILEDRVAVKNLADPKEADLSPYPRTNRTRYWFRGKANQNLPLGLDVRLDADFVSDQDYLKEFESNLFGYQARPDLAGDFGREMDERRSPTRRSSLRLGRDGEDYSFQAATSYYERPENPPTDNTPQPLAEGRFEMLPGTLRQSPPFLGLDTEYGYIWRDAGIKGHRASVSPGLSYPMWLGRYVEFEPSLGYTLNTQWTDEAEGQVGNQSKGAYDFKARLSATAERVFNLGFGNNAALKHKLAPSLSYEYRAPRAQDKQSAWFEPIDVEGKVNRISFSLENFFDARKEKKKNGLEYVQWGTLTLTQGYDVTEARRHENPEQRRRPFDPLVGEMNLRFSSFLTLDSGAEWDYYDHSVSRAEVALDLSIPRSGGRFDSLVVNYLQEKGVSKSLSYSLTLNLPYGFTTGFSESRDLMLRRDIDRSCWLDYQSQCWGVRVIAQRAENVNSFMVTFRLLGMGSIKSR